MKFPFLKFAIVLLVVSTISSSAQRRPTTAASIKRAAAIKPVEVGQTAVVVDVVVGLCATGQAYGQTVMRVGRGRKVQILGSAEADGVKFYRVATTSNFGWIQADAVFGKFRPGDEEQALPEWYRRRTALIS